MYSSALGWEEVGIRRGQAGGVAEEDGGVVKRDEGWVGVGQVGVGEDGGGIRLLLLVLPSSSSSTSSSSSSPSSSSSVLHDEHPACSAMLVLG